MTNILSIEDISLDLSNDKSLSLINDDMTVVELFSNHFTEDTICGSELLSQDDNDLELLLSICETLAISQVVRPDQENIFISSVSEQELQLLETCLSLTKTNPKSSSEDMDLLKVLRSRLDCFSKFISNF